MHAYHLLVVIAGTIGQAGGQPPLFAEYAKSVTFYYKAPDPALGPRMLKDLLKVENLDHPWFVKNQHVLNLVAGQLGDIGTGNPKIVREYEAAFPGATAAGRRVILRCLTDCGNKATIMQIDTWLADERYADVRIELTALKKLLEDPARKSVRDRPALTPAEIDRLWGNFFISGEYPPIARILDVLDLPDAQENQVLKRVARWSLGANLQQHPKLMELVRAHVKERPEGSRKAIEAAIGTLENLPGRWLSLDGGNHPLIFGKDGSFECGFFMEKGNWVMAKGTYALMPDDKIATRAQHEGSTLTQTFTFRAGVLSGSRGPNPKVEWKKAQP
jgi:hypothetical protein